MSQEPQSFKSRLKESIKHNPIYTKAIRPLRVKLNTLIESTLDDEAYFVRRHKKIFGYTPDFRNPKTFNEKIIHRILFDRSPVYTALADKLKARIYIAATLYPLYENAIRDGAECNASLDSSLDSSAQPTIQALAKLNLLEPSSTLFAPIDSLRSTLLATNICPYLPKLYGIYKSFDEIDFASLPTSFAIKTNHDCGGVVLVPDKQEFLRDQARFQAAKSKIQQHLATNFYTLFREWHYKDIEPRVFIEELLGASSPANTAPSTESSTDSRAKTFENDDFHNKIAQNPESYKAPTDYKCHIFNGALSHIEVIRGRFVHQEEIALDEQWQKLPFDYEKRATTIPPKPKNLLTMKQIAIALSQPFAYVRVDLYEIDSVIFFGEMTFTPACGTDKFSPQEWDNVLGDRWKMHA